MMSQGSRAPDGGNPVLNVLILYDHATTFTNTVREHLECFSLYSGHRIFYAAATVSNLNPPSNVDLTPFDVVIVHYSVRLCFNILLPIYADAVTRFNGLKMLFIQDEYENTEVARRWMVRLGIHVVFTCVPEPYIDQVYPPGRLPGVEFVNVLTGYAPIHSDGFTPKPLLQRKYVIGYRGRPPLFRYGDLMHQKYFIGRRMREICDARGIPVNIEWDDSKRIYGSAWYEFMQDCRATLGTESGSNVFDEEGQIKAAVDRALAQDPTLTYETIHGRYLAQHEGKIRMNQISPRAFEAIAFKTAMVLFEGEYSGIIKPNIHYIPLKHDFSNVDEVLAKLSDDETVKTLVDRAYADIIQSGRYSYQAFVQKVVQVISRRTIAAKSARFMCAVIAWRNSSEQEWQRVLSIGVFNLPPTFSSEPLPPDGLAPRMRGSDSWETVRRIIRLELIRAYWVVRGYIANKLMCCCPPLHKATRRLLESLRRVRHKSGDSD